MRTDSTRFLSMIRRVVNENQEKELALGTIPSDYSSGLPKVKFDNEDIASSRVRPYLDSYTPTANDRVLMARIGGGWIILGRIVN